MAISKVQRIDLYARSPNCYMSFRACLVIQIQVNAKHREIKRKGVPTDGNALEHVSPHTVAHSIFLKMYLLLFIYFRAFQIFHMFGFGPLRKKLLTLTTLNWLIIEAP